MRALTLSQPWATLHVVACDLTNGDRAKTIESRGWRYYDHGIVDTERVAIHAGKGIDRPTRDAISDRAKFREPFASLLRGCGYSKLDPWDRDYASNFEMRGDAAYSLSERAYLKPLPLGAVVGALRYRFCLPGIEIRNMVDRGQLSPVELQLGTYVGDAPRWGFVSDEAIAVTPIPMRGYQKFWRLPEEIARQLADAHKYVWRPATVG
jgi:hypothetical protein